MRKSSSTILSLLLVFCSVSLAGARQAPEWDVSEWINGSGTTVQELRGKVIIVEFFQLWCPGCNSFSIPLMKKWQQTFSDQLSAGRLFMLSIHTVFEGHEFQNPERLKAFVREKGIDHLVGIDRHEEGTEIPVTMQRYGTRGTPEMVIIDQVGDIRFQRFGGFEPRAIEAFIRKLLRESSG